VLRKGPELLRRLHQPMQHRVWLDLKHTRCTADAYALSEAADHVHDEVDRDALAMEQSTVMLWKVALAGRTVELTPRATAGMAVGAQVAQPQPAAIGTVRMRAKMPGGIHLTRTPMRRGHRIGAHRRRWRGMYGLVCTQSARGLLGQPLKRFGRDGVLRRGLDGLRLDGLLRRHGSSAGPGKMPHDPYPPTAPTRHFV